MTSDNTKNAASIEPPPLPSEDTKPPDMPFFIPNDPDQGVYRFILAAAKRARQLQAGARPLISTASRKPTRIAVDEVRTGAIEVEILPPDADAVNPAYENFDDLDSTPIGGPTAKPRA